MEKQIIINMRRTRLRENALKKVMKCSVKKPALFERAKRASSRVLAK
jgi:hypothetical protein